MARVAPGPSAPHPRGMPSTRGILSLAVLIVLMLAPVAARADGAALLRFLPADAETIAVIDVAAARRNPAMKEWLARPRDGWAQQRAAGIDPARNVDTVLVVASLAGEPALRLAIVEGRFAADVARRLGEGKTEHRHGKVPYWADAETGAAMVGKRLVFAPTAAMPAAIDLVSGKGARLARTAPLRSVIAATGTRQHLWVATTLTGDLRQKAAGLGVDAVGVALGATVGKSLGLDARLLLATDAAATASLDQLRAALPQMASPLGATGFAAALSTLAIDRVGNAVRVTATVSPAELETLGSLLEAFGVSAAATTGP
jgi:hypothetical protein